MNGNVTFVGLNFQERVEEEHLKKEGDNGEACWGIRARDGGEQYVPILIDCDVRVKINEIAEERALKLSGV